MFPIAFHLGSFEVGSYGLLLVAGVLAAMWLAERQAKAAGVDAKAVSNLFAGALACGIVGSKLGIPVVSLLEGKSFAQVVSAWSWRAGGAVHGGVIGGILGLVLAVRLSKQPFFPAADAIMPGLALGQAVGRLGCLAAGCCYGSACDLPWAVTFHDARAAQISGVPVGVALHPVQLYLALANLAVCALLIALSRRRPHAGAVLAAYLVLEGLERFVMESWRGDLDRGVWSGLGGLSTGRVTALAFLVIGAALLAWTRRAAAGAAPHSAT